MKLKCRNLTVFLLLAMGGCAAIPEPSQNLHYREAMLLDQAGDLLHAREALQLAALDEDGKQAAEAYLANIAIRKQKAEVMIPDFQAKVRNTQRRLTLGQTYFKLAICNELLDKRERALSQYDKALEYQPGQSLILMRRGLLKEQMGALAEAEADLAQACESDHTGASAHLNLGLFLCRRGRPEEARPHFRFLQEKGSDYAPLLAARIADGTEAGNP